MQEAHTIDPQSRDCESRRLPQSMDAPSLAHSDDIVNTDVAGGRDDELSFWQHMIAGSVAGMVEHMAMFPVDTVKTRMQALAMATATPVAPPSPFPPTLSSLLPQIRLTPPPCSPSPAARASVIQAVSSIVRSEGAVGLYRGIGAMGLGAGPAHAVYFAVYEAAKKEFTRDTSGNDGMAALGHAAAGAMATVASDAVLTPMDVVKQRLQLQRSPYRNVMDCCTRMLEEEGIQAFYRSYRTTLVMNVPFTAVHFATYEAAKKLLGRRVADEDRLETHLLAGGAAGALASAVTNPMDVVKTRLQCQGVCGVRRIRHGSSVIGSMRSIVAEEGPSALMRGVRARVLFHAPAAAICWSVYEGCKNLLRHEA